LRIVGAKVTVSLDTSGEHLHRRGYRAEAGRAPLRENLVAGLLLRAGWDGSEPLIDPLCGSGTFPIEAALRALRIPPGWLRRFAFEGLPSFDARRWEVVRSRAEARVRDALPHPVFASDRDPEALRLTTRSARRAGVAEQLQVALTDLDGVAPPVPSGLLVTNPPHGVRLGGEHAARRALGDALRGPFRRWRWGVVLAGKGAETLPGIQPTAVYGFRSGGLRLRLALGEPSDQGRTPEGIAEAEWRQS
jgi:putative N6-adenine-specific DNA methylase